MEESTVFYRRDSWIDEHDSDDNDDQVVVDDDDDDAKTMEEIISEHSGRKFVFLACPSSSTVPFGERFEKQVKDSEYGKCVGVWTHTFTTTNKSMTIDSKTNNKS